MEEKNAQSPAKDGSSSPGGVVRLGGTDVSEEEGDCDAPVSSASSSFPGFTLAFLLARSASVLSSLADGQTGRLVGQVGQVALSWQARSADVTQVGRVDGPHQGA